MFIDARGEHGSEKSGEKKSPVPYHILGILKIKFSVPIPFFGTNWYGDTVPYQFFGTIWYKDSILSRTDRYSSVRFENSEIYITD